MFIPPPLFLLTTVQICLFVVVNFQQKKKIIVDFFGIFSVQNIIIVIFLTCRRELRAYIHIILYIFSIQLIIMKFYLFNVRDGGEEVIMNVMYCFVVYVYSCFSLFKVYRPKLNIALISCSIKKN